MSKVIPERRTAPRPINTSYRIYPPRSALSRLILGIEASQLDVRSVGMSSHVQIQSKLNHSTEVDITSHDHWCMDGCAANYQCLESGGCIWRLITVNHGPLDENP